MKLYKRTLIISTWVFLICVLLSCVFKFTCMSQFEFVSFFMDYAIGIACSSIVVIITTFLQFKSEQRKTLNTILLEVQSFFFYYLFVIISLDPNEKTPEKAWEYYYDKINEVTRKISSETLNIEWFSHKKEKATSNLMLAVMQIEIAIAKHSAKNKKDGLLVIVDSSHIKEIKDNAMLLTRPDEYFAKEILENYDKTQCELRKLKFSNNL